MARMFPATCPATKGGAVIAPAERKLFSRLARELAAGWQIIHDCKLRGGVDRGAADFVLLHRDYGIALLGVATPGEVVDSTIAVAAMRATLAEIGFDQRYPGHLAIVARDVVPDAVSDLAAFLAVRFAALSVSAIADPTWPDWLLQRLIPERPEAPLAPSSGAAAQGTAALSATPVPRGLRAPTVEDSWHVLAADKPKAAMTENRSEKHVAAGALATPEVRVAAERIPVSSVAQTRSPLWTGMALAVVVVSVVLVGIAALSHGNGPHDLLARQSAVAHPPAAAGAPDAAH